jgi:glycosyltransferase involved in cell wall biosynthesis
MKRIWLINPAAMPPKYEMRIQTLKRAQYLAQFGHEVTIIGGSFLHNTDLNLINDNRKYIKTSYEGINFIHVKNHNYKGNGIRRIYSLLEFHIRLILLAKKFAKPDVIAQIATVPFGNIIYFLAKRLKAKYIVDVVDLWPESMVALGLVSKNNPLVKLSYLAEKWLYKRADEIVFSMEGGEKYIIEKGWNIESGGKIDLNKVHYINNGVDIGDFDRNKKLFQIADEDLENENIFKVIYLGSIRLANNLRQLIDAAEILKDNSNIQFLIYGDGDDRAFLEDRCRNLGLKNVKFKQKSVELTYVPYILSRSSLNILNYMKSPITRYGGSQSKSFQYMASGKPICGNMNMAFCPITKYNLGISKEFETAQEYADTILSFAMMDKSEYNVLCKNSRNAAFNYDYRKLTSDYEKLLY